MIGTFVMKELRLLSISRKFQFYSDFYSNSTLNNLEQPPWTLFVFLGTLKSYFSTSLFVIFGQYRVSLLYTLNKLKALLLNLIVSVTPLDDCIITVKKELWDIDSSFIL